MVIPKYRKPSLSVRCTSTFFSLLQGKWVMEFGGVLSITLLLSCFYGAILTLPFAPMFLPRWQNNTFLGYCRGLIPILEPPCSWLTGRKEDVGQLWADFFHIWKAGYGAMICFTFGCNNKSDAFSKSIHGETVQVIAQSGHWDCVIHIKHFPIL